MMPTECLRRAATTIHRDSRDDTQITTRGTIFLDKGRGGNSITYFAGKFFRQGNRDGFLVGRGACDLIFFVRDLRDRVVVDMGSLG